MFTKRFVFFEFIHFVLQIFHINIIFTPREFFLSPLVDGLSLELE